MIKIQPFFFFKLDKIASWASCQFYSYGNKKQNALWFVGIIKRFKDKPLTTFPVLEYSTYSSYIRKHIKKWKKVPSNQEDQSKIT